MVVLLDSEKRPLTPTDEIIPTGKRHGLERRRSSSHCLVFHCATFCAVVLFYSVWGFFQENHGKDSKLWNTKGHAHENHVGQYPEEGRFERLFLYATSLAHIDGLLLIVIQDCTGH